MEAITNNDIEAALKTIDSVSKEEITAAIAKHQRSIKRLRRILSLQNAGTADEEKSGRKAVAGKVATAVAGQEPVPKVVDRVVEYLKHSHTATAEAIAAGTGISIQGVRIAIGRNGELFTSTRGGYTLRAAKEED